MPDLKELAQNIDKVTAEQWELLFGFIVEIEASDSFGSIEAEEFHSVQGVLFPYWKAEKLVQNFTDYFQSLDIIPTYDWQSWVKGMEYLNGTTDDIENFDLPEICMLFTQIFKTERFTDGYLIKLFEDKTIVKILKRMQAVVQARV